jgi:ribose transport system ATP-binding protein
MDQVALKMVDISKSFRGGNVRIDVSFNVHRGEVHFLLGHNCAGKGFLMKPLMGVHQPDSGKYIANAKEVRFANPAEAQQNCVSMCAFPWLPDPRPQG